MRYTEDMEKQFSEANEPAQQASESEMRVHSLGRSMANGAEDE